MGRPTDLTDELSIEIARHLIAGCSIADACALAGIGERTYHDWVARGDAGEEPWSQFSQLTRAARRGAQAPRRRDPIGGAGRLEGRGVVPRAVRPGELGPAGPAAGSTGGG